MRSLAWALLVGAALAGTSGRESRGRIINVSTAEELVQALRDPLEDVTINLAPGRYVLLPQDERVEVGTCHGYELPDKWTAGARVSGRRVRLVGSSGQEAVIASDANFRIYFKDCVDCELSRVIITAVASDSVSNISFNSVRVDESSVRIANCVIRGDDVSSAGYRRVTHGIWGDSGAILTIEANEIARNTNAISLRANARATIKNNLIEGFGVLEMGGGEAVALVCDAAATVERNHIRRLTGGISLDEEGGAPSLLLTANIIENIFYGGVTASGDKLGRVRIEQNVFYDCGSGGIAVRANGDQTATRNLIVGGGRRKPQASAVMAFGAHADAAIRKNTLYDNMVTDPKLDRDVPREAFWRARRPWTRTYRNTAVGVDGRHKFYESAFLTRYGKWAD